MYTTNIDITTSAPVCDIKPGLTASRLLEKGSKGDLTESDIHDMLPTEHSCNVVSSFAPAWNHEVEKAKLR